MNLKRDAIVELISDLEGAKSILSCKKIDVNLYITRSEDGALGIFLDGVPDDAAWPRLQNMDFYPKQRYSISTLPEGEERFLSDCVRVEVSGKADDRAVASIIEMMIEDAVAPYSSSDLLAAIERYRTLLKGSRPRLTDEELKGLWGELLFLREMVFRCKSQEQCERCLDSWKASSGAKRDFRMPNTGLVFEVKTTEKNSRTHEISSADQLTVKEGETAGYLVSIGVKREEGGMAMTISSLCETICQRLEDDALENKLRNLLNERKWTEEGGQDISLILSVGIPLKLFGFDVVPSLLPLPEGVPNASWVVQMEEDKAVSRDLRELIYDEALGD